MIPVHLNERRAVVDTNPTPTYLANRRSWFGKAMGRIARPLVHFRRDLHRNRLHDQLLRKSDVSPSGPGLRIIMAAPRTNGLYRAYRYEIERLSAEGRLTEETNAVLLLGQPRMYRKLLVSPPADFPDTYRIGLWVTEFEVFPPDWAFAFDIVHEIWTPSEFSARAIRSATDIPVKVVPHAVKVPEGEPMDRARFGVADDQFLGLAIMDLGTCPDRKNPLAHVRAWKAAFGDDPSTRLLMKVKFGKQTGFAKAALLREIGESRNISLVTETFSDVEMTAFQRMADVYVSLHRSEGYGLNIHEMLELGIPTVATGWSGNMDFMMRYKHANAVPYEIIPYADPTRHYQGEGLVWAEPDIEAAAKILARIQHEHGQSR